MNQSTGRERITKRKKSPDRGRNSRGSKRADRREDAILKLLASQAKAFDEMAFQQKERRQEDAETSSLISSWTENAKNLFLVLSARSWEEQGFPSMNGFFREATRGKKVQRALSQIEDISYEEDWGGMASQSGLIRIFAKGFSAPNFLDSPDGFTAFVCFPRDKMTDRSNDELKHFYQELFGKGELSEEKLRTLTKQDWFLPKNRYEAQEQLKVTVKLIDLFTARRSMGSIGYQYGMDLLDRYSVQFAKQTRKDSLFLVRFIHLLDAVFQRFCGELTRMIKFRDPVIEARRRELDLFQKRIIDSALGNFFQLGQDPNLPLPAVLEKTKGVGDLRGGGGGGGVSPPLGEGGPTLEGSTDPRRGKGRPPDAKWMTDNPSPIAAWRLPDGKQYGDFFGKGKEENQRNFPRVRHHIKGPRLAAPCLKYHTTGRCLLGSRCGFSHLGEDRLTKEEKESIDNRFNEIYRS